MLAVDVEWGIPILLLLVLVLFGGAKIPQLARSLGSAQREFKKGASGEDDDDKNDKAKKPESKSD